MHLHIYIKKNFQLFQQERSRRGIGSTSIVTSGPDGKYTPLYGETPPSINSINSRSAVLVPSMGPVGLKNGRNSTARDMFLAFDEKTNVSNC